MHVLLYVEATICSPDLMHVLEQAQTVLLSVFILPVWGVCVCVIGYVRGLSSGELMEASLPHTGAEFEYSDPKCRHLLSGMN